MVTRASTRKDSPAKSGAKPEPAAQKSAARKTTTDLISPKTKKTASENETGGLKTGQRGRAGSRQSAKQSRKSRHRPKPNRAASPPPKPETVSLIEEKRPKKPETAVGPETRSVLPPISKIRAKTDRGG